MQTHYDILSNVPHPNMIYYLILIVQCFIKKALVSLQIAFLTHNIYAKEPLLISNNHEFITMPKLTHTFLDHVIIECDTATRSLFGIVTHERLSSGN